MDQTHDNEVCKVTILQVPNACDRAYIVQKDDTSYQLSILDASAETFQVSSESFFINVEGSSLEYNSNNGNGEYGHHYHCLLFSILLSFQDLTKPLRIQHFANRVETKLLWRFQFSFSWRLRRG